jgi:threonine/homoserine/homoserine lactone efflux protein
MGTVGFALVAYTAAATLLTITPGLDTALVLRTAATEGARTALWSGLGIVTGCLIWATLVAAGLGILLIASHLAYTVLRWAGAAYLLLVGLQLLWKPRTHFAEESTAANKRTGSAFTRGALTNLLNPKVGIFYVSFLPQFIPNTVPVPAFTVLLGVIHAVLGLIWFMCLVAATRPLVGWLRRAAVVKMLDRITGGIFIAFGARLAAASNGR